MLRNDAIQLPAEHHVNVQDYHGVAVDSKGRVYIGYHSSQVNENTRCVARFNYSPQANPPFQFDRFLGTHKWVSGRLHGLNIILNEQGQERLLLVYNKQKVILCDLEGQIKQKGFQVLHRVFGKASDGNKSSKSKGIGIFDGYKSNIFHELDLLDGHLTGHHTGCKGHSHGQTNTAHGVGLDPDGNYVVADRGNQRLTWWNPDMTPLMISGKQKQMSMQGFEVCNIAFQDDVAVVPALNSRLAILGLSSTNESGLELLSQLDIPKAYIEKGYDGVHDANFTLDHKYIVVAVWQRNKQVAPTLFALQRIESP